jgi:hypothetical protein
LMSFNGQQHEQCDVFITVMLGSWIKLPLRNYQS